jgi:hypothetical protein
MRKSPRQRALQRNGNSLARVRNAARPGAKKRAVFATKRAKCAFGDGSIIADQSANSTTTPAINVKNTTFTAMTAPTYR